jgi:hypothetical protein
VGLALPLVGGLTLGLLESGEPMPRRGTVRAAYCAFLLHHPVAPQIWMTMRGSGVAATFTEWGPWVPLYGVGVWLLLLGLGLVLAVRGLRREVY